MSRARPQGVVLSPLLSNIYLDPLDHWMAEQGYEMVRYADDFFIMCRSQEEAERALTRTHPASTRSRQTEVYGLQGAGAAGPARFLSRHHPQQKAPPESPAPRWRLLPILLPEGGAASDTAAAPSRFSCQ
jgi:hypothetical protein